MDITTLRNFKEYNNFYDVVHGWTNGIGHNHISVAYHAASSVYGELYRKNDLPEIDIGQLRDDYAQLYYLLESFKELPKDKLSVAVDPYFLDLLGEFLEKITELTSTIDIVSTEEHIDDINVRNVFIADCCLSAIYDVIDHELLGNTNNHSFNSSESM